MSELLLVVLLSTHLVLLDVAMAGPLVCIWLEWRETRRGDRLAGRIGLALARATAWALGGGIAIGVALLAIRWWNDDTQYLTALVSIPRSRLWFGVGELAFSLACMIVYARAWQRWSHRRWAHRALAAAAASNLLIHFPALFVIVSIVSTRPEALASGVDADLYRRLLVDGEVLSRVAHVWAAAFGVAGAALMGLALHHGGANPDTGRLIRRGAALALVAALLQIPTGLWMTVEMPEAARGPLVGGDIIATGLFLAALTLAFWWMHTLAGIALGDGTATQVRRSIGVLLVVVVLMVATRCRVQNKLQTAVVGNRTAVVAAAPDDHLIAPGFNRHGSRTAHLDRRHKRRAGADRAGHRL